MKKYDGVMQRVRIIEEKYGIKYAKADGKAYNTFKVIYIIAAVWSLIMNLLFTLGMLFTYGGTDKMSEVSTPLITVGICTAAIIIGFVLSHFKLYLPAGILSLLGCVFTVLVYMPLQRDSLGLFGFVYSFYWRHLGPNVIMAFCMIVMTVIAVRARVKTDRQYKKVTENLFAQYKTQDITDEQWDEFLKNYTPYEKMAVTQDER